MPSGSHGGSAGGHSSGGSSFGGHSRSGTFVNSKGTRSPRPMVFFGGRYYVPVKQSSVIRTLFLIGFFILFFAVMFLISSFSMKAEINKIKVDQKYYVAMIQNAEQDSDYLKSAIVTDKFYNEDYNKWYITYTLKTVNNEDLNGYTFSVYTLEEVNRFEIGQEIQVAVNSKIVTMQTDSIPLDYKDMPLEKDGQYVNAKTGFVCFVIISSVLGVISVALFVVGGILLAKKIQKNEQIKEKEENPNLSEQENIVRCKYCGSKLKESSVSCENCGAKL